MDPRETLKPLIDRIKKDGVEAADTQARGILDEARKKARSIREEAEIEARRKMDEARESLERDRAAFDQAMKNAARDLLAAVRQELADLAGRVLKRETGDALTPELVSKILLLAARNWGPEAGEGLEALVPEKDLDALEKALREGLADEAARGITLVPVPDVKAGFRLGKKGEDLYFDFTDEGLSEALSAYLAPRIARYLKED